MATTDNRLIRRSGTQKSGDQRANFEIDYDRLLYSHGLRRLAGVTQTVSAIEGWGFHNRLTHSLKVAQVARRIAENLARDTCTENEADRKFAKANINPDVVAAAALAHDLGHPPFGHVAEDVLHDLVNEAGDSDGFEGNAQSFRIVATLERRFDGKWGLDLTRATLGAILKYPWTSKTIPSGKGKKFGAYASTEQAAFDFARESSPSAGPTIEAAIMDLADDITFSVHDLEDFVMQGLVPLQKLQLDDERERFIQSAEERWIRHGTTSRWTDPDQYVNALGRVLGTLKGASFALGTTADRARLRGCLSGLIQRFVQSTKLIKQRNAYKLDLGAEIKNEIELLKEITWEYVIEGAALAAQQAGHGQIIRTLFDYYYRLLKSGQESKLPPLHQHDGMIHEPDTSAARRAADIICTLTDEQATSLFARLSGFRLGTIHAPL